jgi:hypothetical protein
MSEQEGNVNVISATPKYPKQRRKVLGREMAYVEAGKGDPGVPARQSDLLVPLAQRNTVP